MSTLPSSSQVVIYRLRRTILFSCKAHRALILLLLASKPNPLRWAPVWFLLGTPQALYRNSHHAGAKPPLLRRLPGNASAFWGRDRPQALEGRKLTPRRFSFDAVFFCRFLKSFGRETAGLAFFPELCYTLSCIIFCDNCPNPTKEEDLNGPYRSDAPQ